MNFQRTMAHYWPNLGLIAGAVTPSDVFSGGAEEHTDSERGLLICCDPGQVTSCPKHPLPSP